MKKEKPAGIMPKRKLMKILATLKKNAKKQKDDSYHNR